MNLGVEYLLSCSVYIKILEGKHLLVLCQQFRFYQPNKFKLFNLFAVPFHDKNEWKQGKVFAGNSAETRK